MNNYKRLFALFFWGIVILFFIFFKGFFHFTNEDISLEFYNFLRETGWKGGLIFIIVYTFRPIIFFPASILSFLSGVLWGPFYGVIFTIIGSNLSGQVGYFLSLYFHSNFVSFKKSLKFREIEKYSSSIILHPFIFVVSLRLLFLPYDIVSFFCGLSKIPWRYFTLGSIVGTFPATLTFVLAGSAFYGKGFHSFSDVTSQIDKTFLYFALGIFIMALAIAKGIKKFFKH